MLVTDLKSKIVRLVETDLAATDQFLVDVVVVPHKAPNKIKVTIDGNVSVADCERLNRSLLKTLEHEHAGEAEQYTFEVSTPGVDTPLKLTKQYTKNQGRVLQVTRKDGSRLEGKLTQVTHQAIHLSPTKIENDTISVSFSEIEKALVRISFK